jgi:ribosome biogenesis GTPase A
VRQQDAIIRLNHLFDFFDNDMKTVIVSSTVFKEIIQNKNSLIKKFNSKEKELLRLAVVGSTNSGKSTLINFLITGKHDSFFPSMANNKANSTPGDSTTHIPMRITFGDHDKYILELVSNGN